MLERVAAARRRSPSSRTPGRSPSAGRRLRRRRRPPRGRSRARRRPAAAPARPGSATAISRCEVWPRSSPTGTRTRSSRSLRHAAVGEVAEHRLAALARGDQPDERRARPATACSTASSSPWPWVATTTTERASSVGGGEVGRVDDVGAASPARRPGRPGCAPSASGRRRPGAGSGRRVRRRPPWRPRSGTRSGCTSSRPAPPTGPNCSGVPEQQQPRLAVADHPLRLADARPARRRRRRSSRAPRPSAVMMAREPGWPEDGALPPHHGGQRELLAAPRQLGGLLEDLPAVDRPWRVVGRQSSVFTGGAPETSCRWVSAS